MNLYFIKKQSLKQSLASKIELKYFANGNNITGNLESGSLSPHFWINPHTFKKRIKLDLKTVPDIVSNVL